jgi:hypothetical protein
VRLRLPALQTEHTNTRERNLLAAGALASIPIASPKFAARFKASRSRHRIVGELCVAVEKIIHLWGAKNYSSVRYAYCWCEQLASYDPDMGSDMDGSDTLMMRTLYHEYAARAPSRARHRKIPALLRHHPACAL